jgi:hypothetical protein
MSSHLSFATVPADEFDQCINKRLKGKPKKCAAFCATLGQNPIE